MAGHAARRIVPVALGLLLLAASSWAAFGGSSYSRLFPDRLVIITGSERFVLKRDAAWVLADEKQTERFKKWREKSELPADLGKLVADLPKLREIAFLGEVSARSNEVDFQLPGAQPQTIKLSAIDGGFVPDTAGAKVFADIAKGLKMKPSTLVLDMADTGGDVSEAKAWAKIMDRFKSPEFFILVGKRQGVFWAHGATKPVETPPKQNPATVTHTETPKTNEPIKKPEKPADIMGIVLWSLLGLSVIGNGALLYFFKLRPAKSDPAREFPVSHHERQLIEKVRDEQKKTGASGDEELIVGKMMESYDQYDKVNKERLDLLKYRQYKEEFDVFDKQAQEIKRKSDERQKEIQELGAELRRGQGRYTDLQKELAAAKDTIAALESDLKRAEKLLDDVGQWQTNYRTRLDEMVGQMRT